MESVAIEILKKCAVTTISSKIYSNIASLYINNEIKKQLTLLDLEVSIRNMELLIDNIYNSQFKNNLLRKSIQHMVPLICDQGREYLDREGHLNIINKFVEKEILEPNEAIDDNELVWEDEDEKDENENEKDEDEKDDKEKENIKKKSLKNKQRTIHPLVDALENIKDIMNKIYIELRTLNDSMNAHNNRYFSNWYTNSNMIEFLNQIKEYEQLFIKRKITLMQLIPLYIEKL